MNRVMALVILNLNFLSVAALADMPKLDKKMSEDQRAQKCSDWSRTEVGNDKKKSAEYKEAFQKCLSKNGLPSSLAFSSKYKL